MESSMSISLRLCRLARARHRRGLRSTGSSTGATTRWSGFSVAALLMASPSVPSFASTQLGTRSREERTARTSS
eukprot:3749824-Pyramimonas_sp.AAC.1